jgi:hypothetical protein
MMDDKRLEAEKQVLASQLPSNSYRFMDMDTSKPYLVVAAKTSLGNLYTLRIDIEDFPEMVPNMYVKNKILLKSGQPILENDENFKTLCYKDDMIGIRHYSNESWSPMVPLYHVYIRGKMWLEMYEQYFNS